MRTLSLPLEPRLRAVSRLPALGTDRDALSAAGLVALVLLGSAAAVLTTYVRLHLRLPGHQIVFAVFPMALGLALVPRRWAGSTMGLAALATLVLLGVGGAGLPGIGARTSLVLTGPLLDLAVRAGRSSGRLYAGFVLAGIASNAAAMLLRGGTKMLGLDASPGARAFGPWMEQALVTYAVCGLIAGLLSAAAWFHLRDEPDGPA